jgi:hypothetical protein
MASPAFWQTNIWIILFIYVFIATPSCIRSRMLINQLFKVFLFLISFIHSLICILSFSFPVFIYILCLHVSSCRLEYPAPYLIRQARNLFASVCPLLKREADHSPQSRAEVKNSWNYTSLPHESSWTGISWTNNRKTLHYLYFRYQDFEDGAWMEPLMVGFSDSTEPADSTAINIKSVAHVYHTFDSLYYWNISM